VSRRAAVLLCLALAVLSPGAPSGLRAGVKYGDAVPGTIRPSDLERIKLALHLDRFSVIAAVRLGVDEGREVVLSEPLSDETLKIVKNACDAGGFCPDPVGFVASRVRIVLLLDKDVDTLATVDKEARGLHGRMADLAEMGVEGEILGWNGRPEASEGHVALSLTPVVKNSGGEVAAGLSPPLLIRFNPKRGRFQVFDCLTAEGGGPVCSFVEEPGN